MIGATLRHTLNPTRLDAGYKTNVIPQTAEAQVDGRFLPGYEEDFFATVDELLGPDVTRDFVHHDHAVETEYEGALVAAMEAALTSEDAGALPVPYCLSGGRTPRRSRGSGCGASGSRRCDSPGIGLFRNVPWCRRTGSGGRAALRRARSRPFP
ncbi:peptidase dimerization domain-containing protein [Actinomadura yumaensis]|uniref:peptidase dimerization domain-containing protein n=1 Tax=Actinomadura yumaensis TaxID=111807 RepID=UPI00360A56C3